MKLLIWLLVAAVLALSISVGYEFHSLATNRQQAQSAWRGVICAIEQAVEKNPRADRAQKREAIRFYNGLLINDIHTTGCGLKTP